MRAGLDGTLIEYDAENRTVGARLMRAPGYPPRHRLPDAHHRALPI